MENVFFEGKYMEQVPPSSEKSAVSGSSESVGTGPVLRELVTADLPKLRKLIALLNWNQLDDEWLFMLEQAPETTLGMILQDRVIGTAAALPYPNGVAWINMVIVEPGVRGGDIGSRLLRELLSRRAGLPFKLDATPEGAPFYRALGFVEEKRLVRLTGRGGGGGRRPEGVALMTAGDLPELIQVDAEAFGSERAALMKWLLRRSGRAAFRLPGSPAFLLSRPGRLFRQLGPLYAPDLDSAVRLLLAALYHCAYEFPMIDVPEAQRQFITALEGRGFVVQRPFFRMALNNADGREEDLSRCFAIAGPEFG